MNPDEEHNVEPAVSAGALRRRRDFLLLVTMLVVVLGIPTLFGRSHVPEPFDQSVVDQFELEAPDIVFLGNSLLDTRIDPEYLGEITGQRVNSLAIDGTGPGIWRLQLENIVGASSSPPGTVFVFFHDDLITRPISFTGAVDHVLIERLTHSNVSGYGDAWPKDGDGSIKDRISSVFASIYPVADRRGGDISVVSLGGFVTGMNRSEIEQEAETAFAFDTKRDQTVPIQQPKFHGRFDSAIDNSHLPAMIQFAHQLDIELTFVRVSARPRDDGSPNEPVELASYSSDIAAYLEAKGVRYIDMTGHDGIDAAMYHDGYHLKPRFRSDYTEIFGEWLLADMGLEQ